MMKRVFLYTIICILCFNCVINAQNAKQYKMMYDTIINSLSLGKAYVSDSLWEIDYYPLKSYGIISRDSCSILETQRMEEKAALFEGSKDPYKCLERLAKYSEVLHSNFDAIEDAHIPISPWSNIIYFSSSCKSCVSADVYTNARRMDFWKGSFPIWGYYGEWHYFLFQIRNDSVIVISKTQVHEM